MSNQSPTANSTDQFPAEPFGNRVTPAQPRERAHGGEPNHEQLGMAERQRLETEDTEDDDEFDEDAEEYDEDEEDSEQDDENAAPDPTNITS